MMASDEPDNLKNLLLIFSELQIPKFLPIILNIFL